MEQDKQKRKSVNNDAVSLRNTLNELTGAEWLYFTKSILVTAYPSEYGHELPIKGVNICLRMLT